MLAGSRATSLAAARERKLELLAMFAHPAGLARGNPGNESIVGNVVGHDRSGGDESETSNGNAADDCAIGSEAGARPHPRLAKFMLSLDSCARIVDVREHGARATEDGVLEDNGVVDRNVVLDPAVVPDNNPATNKDVLAENDVAPEPRATANVDEMPDARPLANIGAVIDVSTFVLEVAHGVLHRTNGWQSPTEPRGRAVRMSATV